MIGTTIGKYRILAQLGRGATGIVYRALDETLDREVAIKVLNPDLANAEIVKRFRTEAALLARLNHADIAIIYELVQRETDLLMVMELVRGESLEQLCERLGAVSLEHAASLAGKILAALGHAHEAGIVHRDVKPANVMVSDRGDVKIMDFGIARMRGTEHMTVDGCTIGTPAYMPPEQVLGEEVDGRSDLYAVGVILYRLLTGRLPFEADTPFGMLQKQVAEQPTALRVLRPDLPEWCDTVMARALAKRPGDRYQSAEEFRAALASAAGIAAALTPARTFGPSVTAPRNSEEADSPSFQTVAIPRAEGTLPRRPGEQSPIEAIDALLARARHLTRTRKGTIVATMVVVTALAYVAFDGPPEVPLPAAIKADAFPTVVFSTKALVGTGNRQRERDVQLLLGEGRVSVVTGAAPDKPLYSVPYRDVLSMTYSRGHDPMWKSADGPARVTRFNGGTLGKLGIFVDREWLALETTLPEKFIVLRVEQPQAGNILAALEERTGRTAEILGRR
jgi:serine/threonine-protein kinase